MDSGQIAASCGEIATIDADDYDLLSGIKWWSNGGYFHGRLNGRLVSMHRLIMGVVDDKNSVIDHIDRNPLNNRRANLRICTHTDNCRNSKGKNVKKTTIYKGVWWSTSKQRYYSQITVDNKCLTIGSGQDATYLAHAYDAFARYHYKEFAFLNFPDEELLSYEQAFSIVKKRLDEGKERIKGICWNKDTKKYEVCITVNYKKLRGGFFSNIEDAKEALSKLREQERLLR